MAAQRDQAFCRWLESNGRAYLVEAYQKLQRENPRVLSWCDDEDLVAIFKAVNSDAASDDKLDLMSYTEFLECLGRLALHIFGRQPHATKYPSAPRRVVALFKYMAAPFKDKFGRRGASVLLMIRLFVFLLVSLCWGFPGSLG